MRSAILRTTLQIFAGAGTALFPITLQIIGANLLGAQAQAMLALSIGVGAFLASMTSAVVIETRLADPRSTPKSYVPRWITVLGVIFSLLLMCSVFDDRLLYVSAPIVMIALLIGRTHGVTENLVTVESVVGAAMASAAGASVLVAPSAPHAAVVIISAACLFAVCKRSGMRRHVVLLSPPGSSYVKVGAETAITALVPLVLNVFIYWFMTPESAVAFRMVVSVLGLLQPVLGFLRTRQLAEDSKRLTFVLTGASGGVLALILSAEGLKVFSFFFGSSWDDVTMGALLLACMWKLFSIFATAPFAALRRQGELTVVLRVRLSMSILFMTSGYFVTAFVGSLAAVFASLAAIELIAAVTYWLVWRNLRRIE